MSPVVPRFRCVAVLAQIVVLAALPLAAVKAQCLNGTNAALQFDGGDWVRVPSVPSGVLDGFQDFTIECWFRISGGAGSRALISKSSPSSTFNYFLRVENANISFFYNASSALTVMFPAASNGSWHHLSVSRMGSLISIFGNGVLLGTGTYANALPASTSDFAMGVQLINNSSAQLFTFLTGGMDEVRVWNVGRTQAEINATMFSVLAGNEPGLMGYWRLNDAAGQTIINSAAATSGSLSGTLGVNSSAQSDDPTWSFASTAPILYCLPGTGQPNSVAATLRVNGVGYLGVNGPHRIQVPTTGPVANRLTLSWSGPPNAPLLLLAGTLQANAAILPCNGSLDLSLVGLTVVGDFFTSPFPLNYLFVLNSSGAAETSFTVPTSVLGTPWVSLQGAVFTPGCGSIPYTLTSAFEIR